jgi:murein DD-endopeptidase MepM/ murein hydrolase activator NlpD
MRRLGISFICFVCVGVFTVLTTHIYAQTAQTTTQSKEQLQAQIDERARLIQDLEKEIKLYSELADKTSKEAKTLNTYIRGLENQVGAITADIKKSQVSIDKSNLELKQISTEITGNEEQLARMKAAIMETLYMQYISDNINIIENLLANRNLLASVQDIDQLQIIQSEIETLSKNIRKEKDALEANKTEEQKRKLALETEKNNLQVKQKSLDITRAEQKKELEITKNQEKNYQAILEDKKKKKVAFEKELFDYENRLKYVLDPSSIPKANNSALTWPLANVFITQRFGRTSASGRLYVSGTHNGVDFRAAVGTPVLSAGNGRVAGTGNTDAVCRGVSFGKWILIKYDNGLATTYGHLSNIAVAPGQAVLAGEVVGYSGNTGYSTGPHLHVSMYPADAVRPVTRPSASCPGVSMTMPVSAVSAYLDPLVYFPK